MFSFLLCFSLFLFFCFLFFIVCWFVILLTPSVFVFFPLCRAVAKTETEKQEAALGDDYANQSPSNLRAASMAATSSVGHTRKDMNYRYLSCFCCFVVTILSVCLRFIYLFIFVCL
jgi:hypothetical protein